jgi:DNA-binding HxlR family transcriptional regulator
MTVDRCPTFQATIELVGRRWNGAVIMAANEGARRFKEFRAAIPDISERLLAQRLHELEDAGILVRDVIAARPVQIFYSLSKRGKELVAALEPLIDWGERGATG